MADEPFDNLVVNKRLGIGISEPATQLHIATAATEGISSQVFVESLNGSLLKVTAESNSASIGTENAFPLSIQTDGVPRIVISGAGNITITESLSVQNSLTVTGNANIGTDTTPANLQVKGNVTANTFSGNGTSLSGLVKQAGDTMTGPLTIKANLSVSGNVGIGTTSPTARLHIYSADNDALKITNTTLSKTCRMGVDYLGVWIEPSENNSSVRLNANPSLLGLFVRGTDGNVGIGTLNPGTKLEIKGHLTLDMGESPILFTGTGSSELNRYLQLINSPALGSASGLKAGGILVSDSYAYANPSKNDLIVKGNVGIGTANPTNKLHVVGQGPVTIENAGEADILFKDTSSGQQWQVGANSTGWYVYNNAYFLVVKKDSGNVGIGTTSPAYKLDVAGEVHASNFPTSSDVRLKKDVTQLTNVLDKLEKIRGVAFEWNELYESLGRSTGHKEIGVTAQEVEAVFPELVTTWGDEGYKAVDYGRLTSVLIEAAKELNAQNSALKQRIEVLEKAMAGSQAKT